MATQANGRNKLRFSIFEVDLATGEVCKRGVPLSLQEKPFQILALLVEHPGEVVTREDLQKRLWPDGTNVDFDKGLNTAVKKLRQVLGDSADAPVFIETLPRKGYRFIAPVNSNGTGLAQHDSANPDLDRAGHGASKKQILIAVVVLLAVAAAAGFFLFRKRSARNPGFNLQDWQVTRVTKNGKIREMAISPDGKYLAYALRDGIEQSLWTIEIATQNEVQLLAPDTVNFSGIEFSPDGRFVYFIRSETTNPVFGYLNKMPAKGGPVQKLIRDADSPVSFSPDGQRFVYTRGYPPRNTTDIRIANADGSGDHPLINLSGHQVYEAGATWSPKDNVIAVPIHIIGEQSRFVLYAITIEGRVTELFSSQGDIGRPLWVSSGSELLLTLEDLNSHRGQLWKISYPGGQATRLTNDLSDYSSATDLTRDGTVLATIVSSASSSLWAAPAGDLSRPSQITSGEPSFAKVRVLPDGKLLGLGDGIWSLQPDGSHRVRFVQSNDPQWIEVCGRSVLVLSNDAGHKVLLRYNEDGTEPAAIGSGDVLSPVCSPDGESAYYLNFAHPEMIHRISFSDGSTTSVGGVLGDTLFGNLAISPDGRFLAYPYQQYSPPFVASGGGSLVNTFKVPGFLGSLRWSPDGRSLQYLLTHSDATNLWEQSLSGGNPKQLTYFNTGEIFDFAWSLDGKQLFLTRGQSTRDIVLLKNSRNR